MRYAPPGFCVNDFDLYEKDGMYHLLHLQGPLVYPFDATILETTYGHATSPDLINWTTQAPVFEISHKDNFDNSAVWTMRVLEHHGKGYMFYTGVAREPSFYQSIGLVTCENLATPRFQRYTEKPILTTDTKWYQTTGKLAWRDPFVVRDERHDQWLMFIAAKEKDVPEDRNGCIAIATSDDLLTWQCGSPLITPRKYSEMECPVYFTHDNKHCLLVSISDDSSIHLFEASDLHGPYTETGIIAPKHCYAPRLIRDKDNRLLLVHTVPRKYKSKNDGDLMRGYISQPKEVSWIDNQCKLTWYDGCDSCLEKVDWIEDGNYVVEMIPDSTEFTVELSSSRDCLKIIGKDGTMVVVNSTSGLTFSYGINTSSVPKSIKLLCFNEYLEVYINSIFTGMGIDYLLPHEIKSVRQTNVSTRLSRINLRYENIDPK